MERALLARSPGLWIVTITIVIAGAVLVLAVADGPERERLEALEPIRIGDPASRVAEQVRAEPHRCPGDRLDHLRQSFPEGWTPAGVDMALERFAAVTASRWVFAVGDAPPLLCGRTEHQTEIGVDSAGTIVWFVPILGRTPLQLPSWLQPAGIDSTVAPSVGNQ